jgi:hypothetical protein
MMEASCVCVMLVSFIQRLCVMMVESDGDEECSRAAEHRECHDRLIDSKGGHMLSTCYTKLSRSDQEGRHEPKGISQLAGTPRMWAG